MRIVQVVDLSRPLHAGMSVYPGDPEVTAAVTHTVERDGYEVHALAMGSQTGTHIDAPRHVLADAVGTDGILPDQLCAFSVIARLEELDVDGMISAEHLRPAVNEVKPGDGLLIEAGWDRCAGTAQEFHHPALSREAAELIVRAQVAFVGIDAASIDAHDAPELVAHYAFASAGIPILENLANLASVTWEHPLVTVGALPWRGLDGASARVFAIEVG